MRLKLFQFTAFPPSYFPNDSSRPNQQGTFERAYLVENASIFRLGVSCSRIREPSFACGIFRMEQVPYQERSEI